MGNGSSGIIHLGWKFYERNMSAGLLEMQKMRKLEKEGFEMKYALYRLCKADDVQYLELIALYKWESDVQRFDGMFLIELETGRVIL